ncbi:Surface protein from Gram positive cocci [Echinococcus multilocularis]|uniref:Surface protein from Gram positive cocci n=1 Tax=Echinococcus multilocularis TaxID=6211 RepID=A0A068YN64_ECHMU|nr:Surface protein from Gram positive cocci [Echinococcus multilocularis]
MPLLVPLLQYLCLIIILYVTSIRGFRLDPEALPKTGHSHGTLLAIGASVGFLAVVAAITIFHRRKTKDKAPNQPIDGNNQQIGNANPRHRTLPATPSPHCPPPPQLPPIAPQSLYANAMAPPLPNKEYANQRGSNGGH